MSDVFPLVISSVDNRLHGIVHLHTSEGNVCMHSSSASSVYSKQALDHTTVELCENVCDFPGQVEYSNNSLHRSSRGN